MQFVAILGLLVSALVVLPYVAHRLRRRQADRRPFAAAHLVPKALPKARRRSALEDKLLFANRTLAVLALAVLAATPLVRCNRLSLARGGASVAVVLVIDDSMSMRVKDKATRSRFERAVDGAEEILSSLQEGDSVGLVTAGSPARIVLAPTGDLRTARATLEGLTESDRATDLDGAVAMSEALVQRQPQADKRIIVFSDRADGNKEEPKAPKDVKLWFALPELAGEASDCAVIDATRRGISVRVRVYCNNDEALSGRSLEVVANGKKIASILNIEAPSKGGGSISVEPTVQLPPDAPADLLVVLRGTDAIASDDSATILSEGSPGALAIVSPGRDESAATGGAPLVEQALQALKTGLPVTPLPSFPDSAEDLNPFSGLIVDDPSGFTPEQRRALGHFLGEGGIVLVALGPRANALPLGASFGPLLSQPIRYSKSPSSGLEQKTAAFFKEAAPSLADLDPKGRTTLGIDDVATYEVRATWKDGDPFLLRKMERRGEIWLVTLPFSVDASDFPLRPGFLALLDAFARETRLRSEPQRTEVGAAWLLRGSHVEGEMLTSSDSAASKPPKGKPVSLVRDGAASRFVPGLIGAYHLKIDEKDELRVATAIEREVTFRPRPVGPLGGHNAEGSGSPRVDISWAVALFILFLFAAELGLRAVLRARAKSELPPVSVR